jgi:molybdate/tungstate transport system substrate-binding protein
VVKRVAFVLAMVAILGTAAFQLTQSGEILSIYHAGSLSKPFRELEGLFEELHDVDVRREPSGSVEAVRKITELGRKADLVGVSDYSLIPKMMFPEHADWYIQFARNRIVLAHTGASAYAGEIDNLNWYEILSKPDVRFGFGDPNADPGGYRALIAVQLAERFYDNENIFEDLISANTNIRVREEGETHFIDIPRFEALGPSSKVTVGSMEVALISNLETGDIDYLFNYLSVAVQHGLEYVELPEEVDLSSPELENLYGRCRIRFSNGEVVAGKPIVYGLTIPKGAEHPERAIEFIALLLGEEGREILERLGQPPLVPAVASDVGKVPESLRQLVV